MSKAYVFHQGGLVGEYTTIPAHPDLPRGGFVWCLGDWHFVGKHHMQSITIANVPRAVRMLLLLLNPN